MEIRRYLEANPPFNQYSENWSEECNLTVNLGFTASFPHQSISSSILSIVFQSPDNILCLWPNQKNKNIAHFLIGGRPEENETPEQTAIREVSEETGFSITPIQLIGYRHFHQNSEFNLLPDRQFPDFVQLIYVTALQSFNQSNIIENDLIENKFISFKEAVKYTTHGQYLLLEKAHQIFTQNQSRG